MAEVDLSSSFSNCQTPAWTLSGTGEEVGVWSLETKRKVSRNHYAELGDEKEGEEKALELNCERTFALSKQWKSLLCSLFFFFFNFTFLIFTTDIY